MCSCKHKKPQSQLIEEIEHKKILNEIYDYLDNKSIEILSVVEETKETKKSILNLWKIFN